MSTEVVPLEVLGHLGHHAFQKRAISQKTSTHPTPKVRREREPKDNIGSENFLARASHE